MLTSLVAWKAKRQRPKRLARIGGALGGGSAAHGARLPKLEDHLMAKFHSVDERRNGDAVERSERQRRPKVTPKSIKAKAPKRQTRSKNAVRSRGTKQQVCLDLLNRPEGVTVEELQAATGWQQHSVRGFLAGAVKKKLGLTLVSEKADAGSRRYRIASAV